MTISAVTDRLINRFYFVNRLTEEDVAEAHGDLSKLGEKDPQILRYLISLLNIHGLDVSEGIRKSAYRFLEGDASVDLASHSRAAYLDPQTVVSRAEERLRAQGREADIPEMRLMAKGPLGLFLLSAGGLDWEHTDWLFNRDLVRLASSLSIGAGASEASANLEHFFFNEAPAVRATQERFVDFQAALSELVADGAIRDHAVVASIPGGRLRDLLTFETGTLHLHRVAIDIDPQALQGARELATLKNVTDVETRQRDALALPEEAEFDTILSNGLNIYLGDPDAERLYNSFHRALKPGGHLITSHLTPPPPRAQDWTAAVHIPDALRQRHLLNEIAPAKWETHLRPSSQTVGQLERAGFSVKVRSSRMGMFPTFVARKRA
jgi:SAM-dependent methyltransferase